MKNIFQHILTCTLLLLITACGKPEQTAATSGKNAEPAPQLNYHALIIGISDYAGTGWPQLKTARADAKALGDILKSQYGFHVTELTDRQATRGNILRALDKLMTLNDNDAVLIFFAGHGYYDEKMSEGYWIPFGAKRLHNNAPAKEDWLWNSSINRVISSSPARHILLVVDTCYGGSLFRGEDNPDKSLHWYQRAMNTPSRGLITSGNLEPVLDSGIQHSVFANELLHYLKYTEQDVFSASDIAVSIRNKVSQLTGQLVRMGPLNSPAHAGGEFVFTRSNITLPEPAIDQTSSVFRTAESASPLELLADRIEQSSFVRPRVIACLGPSGNDPQATLIRKRLHESLSELGGSILVEREAFDDILQEIELGQSAMADKRASTEIGKLLPASLILFGEIISNGNTNEIHIRVVDTETSQVLCSTFESFTTSNDMNRACKALARRIMTEINRSRPILLPAQRTNPDTLLANWGRFHGAKTGDSFEIISREATDTIAPQETALGTAHLHALGEEESSFHVDWNSAPTNSASIWLRTIL